jgi:hypothetical protein
MTKPAMRTVGVFLAFAVLLILVMPAYKSWRDKARRIDAMSEAKQIMLAYHLYIGQSTSPPVSLESLRPFVPERINLGDYELILTDPISSNLMSISPARTAVIRGRNAVSGHRVIGFADGHSEMWKGPAPTR